MRNLVRMLLGSTKAPVFRPRARIQLAAHPGPIYAIGDIHGCYSEMLEAEARIKADALEHDQRPTILYLGDYVDRGQDSAAVLAHLARPDHDDGIERIALCGNHDEAFLSFIKDGASGAAFLDFGGDATLQSYGVDASYVVKSGGGLKALVALAREAVPQSHIDLLESLPISLSIGRFLFVHAGIRPGLALDRQSDEDMMWIREPFLSQGPKLPITVVHGHTAAAKPVVAKGRIGIDTACYSTGVLTVLKVTPGVAMVL